METFKSFVWREFKGVVKKIFGKQRERTQEQESEEIQKCSTRKAWKGAGIIALISIILWMIGLEDPAVIMFSVVLIWIGTTLKIIKEPEVGFLFQMGELKGQLEAGPHLGLPFVWEIEIRTKATQEIPFEEEMYTNAKKAIKLKGGIYFKMFDAKKAIFLPKEIVKSRMEKVVISKLKFEIGKRPFKDLLDYKGDVEKEVMEASNKETKKDDGYEVIGVEIEDLDEKIESEAAKKRELGEAEAWVSSKKAEAFARPLKDNYPAAVAMAAETIGEKIINRILDVSKKEKKGEEK